MQEQETDQKESDGPREVQRLGQTPWSALDADQKIERMRGIVKDLQHTVEWHSQRFQEMAEQIIMLEEHVHADGKVLIPVSKRELRNLRGRAVSAGKVAGWF